MIAKAEKLLAEYEARFAAEVPTDDTTDRGEKLILVAAILESKPSVIVETGTHRGLTSLYLAVAAKEVGATVHTYDPFDWGAPGNFGKFPELPIEHHRAEGRSCDLPSVDFAFIDGYHEKVHVQNEIDAIFPKLTPGAPVFFHDTNGSNDACDVPGAIASRDLDVEYLETVNGMARYRHAK